MNTSKIKPIVVSPYWTQGNLSVFYNQSGIVEVKAPRSLLNQLTKTCDGQKTLTETIDTLGESWDRTSVTRLIESFKQNGIIYDATSLGDYFWHFVSNPMVFARELNNEAILRLVDKASKRNAKGAPGVSIPAEPTDLHKLIGQRRSTRTFSTDLVKLGIIAKLLWAGYGIVKNPHLVGRNNPQRIKVWQVHRFVRHAVPSAGALYPIRLSLVLLRPVEKYKAGIYNVRFRKHDAIELVLARNDFNHACRSFAEHTICNNAQGIIVISGSFKLSGEKYGNRSVLYVPLEAGHIAQNIHLSAVENGIGTVEIGGFLEEPMRSALKLPADFWPLTTILFGYPETTTPKKQVSVEGLDVRWSPPVVGSYVLPFSMVLARPKGKVSRDWACGRAQEPSIALAKAVSEACEWSACGKIPEDLTRASFRELDDAIDPRTIVCYHERQYQNKEFPLKPFDEKRRYTWAEGRNLLSEREVYILSDCLYFPYNPRTPRYTFANSSGTAAHQDKNEAIKHAVLELVERDAFMIVWLNQLRMPNIRFDSLPGYIQVRIKHLQKAGFRVVLKDFTLDLAPVVFVFIQNEMLPTTICAACSSLDVVRALEHALEEAEAAAYCRLRNQRTDSIRPEDVRRTYHHGDLYGQRKFFRRADCLAEEGEGLRFTRVAKEAVNTWEGLLDRFEARGLPLLTVELPQNSQCVGTNDLHIVKMFVPGIIPMSFGYGLEPGGMGRIYTLPTCLGYKTAPPEYGRLTAFPHPYT